MLNFCFISVKHYLSGTGLVLGQRPLGLNFRSTIVFMILVTTEAQKETTDKYCVPQKAIVIGDSVHNKNLLTASFSLALLGD